MKKIWMAGIACLVVLGITIPVIASNIGKADIKDEEKPYMQQLCRCKRRRNLRPLRDGHTKSSVRQLCRRKRRRNLRPLRGRQQPE